MRPFQRPDLEITAKTKAIRRAERNLFAFSSFAAGDSLVPLLRPASIVREYQAA